MLLTRRKRNFRARFASSSKTWDPCRALPKYRNRSSNKGDCNSSSNNNNRPVFAASSRRKKCRLSSSDVRTTRSTKSSMFKRNGWSRSSSKLRAYRRAISSSSVVFSECVCNSVSFSTVCSVVSRCFLFWSSSQPSDLFSSKRIVMNTWCFTQNARTYFCTRVF